MEQDHAVQSFGFYLTLELSFRVPYIRLTPNSLECNGVGILCRCEVWRDDQSEVVHKQDVQKKIGKFYSEFPKYRWNRCKT